VIDEDPLSAKMEQRSSGVSLLLAVVLIVLLLQLWLASIAIEEYMAEGTRLQLPTFVASGFCFLFNLGLLKYLYDLDREE